MVKRGQEWEMVVSLFFMSGLLSLSLPVGKPILSQQNGVCLIGEYVHLDQHWLVVKGERWVERQVFGSDLKEVPLCLPLSCSMASISAFPDH